MDDSKVGTVKTDVFFSVLKITNIKITQELENELKRMYDKQGMINYRDALSRISVNLEADKPLVKDWVLRSANGSMRNSIYSSSSNRMKIASKPVSHVEPIRAEHNQTLQTIDEK